MASTTTLPGASKPTRRFVPTLPALLVFLISLAIYIALTPRFLGKVWYPTGDEPYYLLIAHSLLHDGDIELSNNFEKQDYWHYYPGELYPRHEAKTTVAGLYAKHAPGVSLLILPGYAIDDWRGTVFTYNLIGALLAANIFLLAYEVSRKVWVALLLWLTFSFSNPLLSYTFLVFPALASALLTVYAVRRIRLDGVAAPLSANGPLRLLLVGSCIGFLPWLHARFLPISLVLFLYLVWREIAARRRAHMLPHPPVRGDSLWLRSLALLLPATAGLASLFAYFQILYSTFLPNYGDHAGMGATSEWVVAFFGSFLDQQWGLFIHAPVFILAIVGVMFLLRERKWGEVFWLAALGLPYAVIILTYEHWWGEWCPAARYWVSLIPLLVIPLASVLGGRVRAGFGLLYLALAGIGWAVMAIFMYEPRLMYNHPVGSSQLLEWIAGGPLLQPLFPTYFRAEWINVWLTVIYVELVLVIVWLGWKQVRPARAAPWPATPIEPAALAVPAVILPPLPVAPEPANDPAQPQEDLSDAKSAAAIDLAPAPASPPDERLKEEESTAIVAPAETAAEADDTASADSEQQRRETESSA